MTNEHLPFILPDKKKKLKYVLHGVRRVAPCRVVGGKNGADSF